MLYPSWRYHATEQPVCVSDVIEDEALGEGWADTPAAFETVASEAELEPVEVDEDENEGEGEGEPDEQPSEQPAQLTAEEKKAKKAAADKARRDAKKAAQAAE